MSYRFGTTLVDPGDEWEGFYGVETVLLTHGHFDHIYGLNRVVELNPYVRVYTNEYGMETLLDARKNMSLYHETPFVFAYPERLEIVTDGQEISLDDATTAKVVFTTGHHQSCITWFEGKRIFTGDSYIPGYKTVTNLPGGNKQQAAESIKIIISMAKNGVIYPGHDYPNK